MELSSERQREYARRLMLARMRILVSNGFYGLLLMHADLALDDTVRTAATDGKKIYFDPRFLDEVADSELDFALMHEIMHIALQHCARTGDRDPALFNIAADIVVNSNILYANAMQQSSITIDKFGVMMHLAPNGDEGYEHTAEEVYKMLLEKSAGMGARAILGEGTFGAPRGKNSPYKTYGGAFDDHSKWNSVDDKEADYLSGLWTKHIADACEAMSARKGAGDVPLFAKRLLQDLKSPKLDWRTALVDFVQEEVADYTFAPPDKRFEGDFFLPDFNDPVDSVKDVLFMIDTSASMDDETVTAVFSEVKGAIDQFNGALKGWLGFFDAGVKEPKPFDSVDELLKISPVGRGGTSFKVIFDYVKQHMSDSPPSSIVIMTDGYADFPNESAAMGIPVLWVMTEDVDPPWGKVAKLKSK